jgi:uncharacterized protein (TIGR02266 family)
VPDPVTTAKSARESLARGLNALQSAPNVPRQLLDLAAPIAQAMGALHQIERANGAELSPHADVALTNTRAALAQLQTQPASHPAVAAAMEAVAGSLSLVHSLVTMAQAPQANPPQASPQQAYAPAVNAGLAFAPTAPQQQAPARQPFRQGGAQPSPGSPLDATYAASSPQPNTSQHPPSPPMPAGAVPVIAADLGTHSPTNFYKGLSGNDIIDHGGLFVSTYMIPKIGTQVRLRVALPGGYEFEANAVVKWSREQSDAGEAPPGFGAQFTNITPEARQLVYRYVRNREPLFHDDF